ncbi:MAG TPA: PAS domain S-box protein [Chroococcidiopsis sp.]
MVVNQRYTVLLIDDSKEDRVVYKRYLQQAVGYSYDILEADSAAVGLEICQTILPDAILLDYLLPDMDGLEFLEALVQQFGRSQVPVLMLTGQGSEAIAARAMKTGAHDYLIKGALTAEALCKGVAYIIEQFQMQQQLLRQQQQRQVLAEITLRIRQSLQMHEILQTTVDEVRQVLRTDRVIIFRFFPDWRGLVAVESCGPEWTSILSTEIHDPCFGQDYVGPFQQGLVTAKSDIHSAGLSACHLNLLSGFEVIANLVVPITKNERLWGLLIAHHCRAPRQWQNSEIELLQQIAAQLGIALQQSTLLQQFKTELIERKQVEWALRAAKVELEQRVAERTEALEAANQRLQQELVQRAQIEQQLRESESRYRAIVEDQTELIIRFAPDSTILFVNDAYCHYFNVEREKILGQSYNPMIYEADREAVAQLVQSITPANPIVIIENRVINSQGELRWTQWINRLLVDAEGNAVELQSVGRDITALKEIEQALRDSEESRRLALDLTHIGSWDMNCLNGNIIWNDNHFSLLGLEPYSVEPSYELWRSHVHPDDVGWVETRFRESLETRTDYTVEYRVVYPNGAVHWLMARAKSIYDDTGKPVRSLGVVLDVTDRKLTEIALQQQTQQEQLRWSITQAIRQSLDLYATLNSTVEQARHTFQVDRVAVYRFQPDWSGDFIAESVAEGWVKLVVPTIQKIWQDTYLQDTQGGRFQEHQTFVISDIHAAGLQPCHIELLEQFQAKAYAIAPIFSGETLWGLLAIYQNTTARNWQTWEVELLQQIASQLSIAIQQSELYSQLQLELQERQQTEAVLREAERRWRSLLDNVQLIVVGLDSQGTIEYSNSFFLQLTGYQWSEIAGKQWFNQFFSPSQKLSTQLVFEELLQQQLHLHHQNLIVTKSGEERIIAWNNTVLQDSDGQPIGIISIGEDITERYRIDQMKSEFISVVSHELRTPLTSMQAALSLLNDKIINPLSKEGEATIQIATEGTDRLVRLVNDILDLERLESGKVRLEKRLCQVNDLVNTAVAQMQELANQNEITLEASIYPFQVEVDGDRFLQLLTNLLSNAIKFSPQRSTVRLLVELFPQSQPTPDAESFLLFTVHDEGRGIPLNKLESIFDRFHQVDASDSRQKGGTGLGLAICRSIVQQHGGKIWVESIVGQGSSFYFTIPMTPPANPPTAE